jgi:hypothetical protein
MTAQQRAKQIYNYMGSFSNAEGAICLLWNHDTEKQEYWEEVWEALIDTKGEHWQKLEFQHNRKDYINAGTL